jgi:hypothetical protein
MDKDKQENATTMLLVLVFIHGLNDLKTTYHQFYKQFIKSVT